MPSPHFGEYIRLLCALDAQYFALWCRYWDGLVRRRSNGVFPINSTMRWCEVMPENCRNMEPVAQLEDPPWRARVYSNRIARA